MKVIVIGLGSMGKRRIRLLRQDRAELEILGVDAMEARREEARQEYGITVYASLDEAFQQGADAALICTSPLSHAGLIRSCLEHDLHVFSEINLVSDGYEENQKLAAEKGKVLFLSSTFLYRKETQYIISRVGESSSALTYLYHIGQYLPDWHPWESIQNYFIGDKRTNGCREILAIELPWIVSCFGPVKDVQVRRSKDTALPIDYNDNILLDITHESGTKGVLAVDVVCRKAVRRFEVYGEDLYLSWNGTPDSLSDYDIETKKDRPVPFFEEVAHEAGYAAFIAETPYREELRAFLHQVEHPDTVPVWDFARDTAILNLIDEMEV